jgi:hypothetical protein
MDRNHALAFIAAAGLVAGLGACSATTTLHAPSPAPSHSVTKQPATSAAKPPATRSAVKRTAKPVTKPATAPAHTAKPTVKPTVQPSVTPTATQQPARQPTASAQAPKAATYRCTLVTDLGGRVTEYQHTSPEYYEGTAYCDAASVAVVQRDESMRQKQSDTKSGGKVHCTYLRMDEAYCTDGTYVSDPSEKDFDK